MDIKVPEEIKIAGYTFKVRFEVAPRECQAENLFGQAHFLNKTIIVDTRWSQEHTDETFIHESLEAVKEHWNVKLEHDDLIRLGKGLHQIFEQLGINFIQE